MSRNTDVLFSSDYPDIFAAFRNLHLNPQPPATNPSQCPVPRTANHGPGQPTVAPVNVSHGTNTVARAEPAVVYRRPRQPAGTAPHAEQIFARRSYSDAQGVPWRRYTVYGDNLQGYIPPYSVGDPSTSFSRYRATEGLPQTFGPAHSQWQEDRATSVVYRHQQQHNNAAGHRGSSRRYSYHGEYRPAPRGSWTRNSIHGDRIPDEPQSRHAVAGRRKSYTGQR